MVERDPGIHVTEIAERTGLSWHTTAYHLAILRRASKVTIQRTGRDQCVFAKGIPVRQRRWFVATRSGQAREILRILLDERLQSVAALSRRTGVSAKVVRRRVQHLEEAGLVVRSGTWRPVYGIKSDVPLLPLLLESGRLPVAARIGSWEWDLTARRVAMSKEGWGVLGVVPEAGRTCQSFIATFVHPDDRAGLAAVVDPAMSAGLPYEHTVRIRTPLGERRIRQRAWVKARDAAGNPIQYCGTLEDMTGSLDESRELGGHLQPATYGDAPGHESMPAKVHGGGLAELLSRTAALPMQRTWPRGS
jgi:DNA-binding transcriptional ArsR family regulator